MNSPYDFYRGCMAHMDVKDDTYVRLYKGGWQ